MVSVAEQYPNSQDNLDQARLPDSPEALADIAAKKPEDLQTLLDNAIADGQAQADSAILGANNALSERAKALGAGPAEMAEGQALLDPVNNEIAALKAKHEEAVRVVGAEATPEAQAEATSGSYALIDSYNKDQLEDLRNKTAADYGENSLVETQQDALDNKGGVVSRKEREDAQDKAYAGLKEKIDAGIVRPDSIQSDMLDRLKLRGKETPVITEKTEENVEQVLTEIKGLVSSELVDFVKEGFVKPDEAEMIQSEAEKYLGIYMKAFPEASSQQVFEVVSDNVRKLAYQTERDKYVFSGSDHGTRHIFEGNLRMADRMAEGLGDRISAKDKVLIHQIIIDHDLGYTVGVAQAKGSFKASKDHPLFSTAFVEANEKYYVQKFGPEGYEMIRKGILYHSYPVSEYDPPANVEEVGFNENLVRSITSTVDALGVTAETKCPAFFRSPEAITVLQKVHLYVETHSGPTSFLKESLKKAKKKFEKMKADYDKGAVSKEELDQAEAEVEVAKAELEPVEKEYEKGLSAAVAYYKDQLKAIAKEEPDELRRTGFYDAIENQFNPRTAEMTLGQYVGVLKDIELKPNEAGKMIPQVSMDISRTQAVIGDFFGDKMAINAFVKAMKDFGISEKETMEMAQIIRQIKEAETEEEKQALKEKLKYSSEKADFFFGAEFADSTPEIQETFEELTKLSIRDEIRGLLRSLESPEARTGKKVASLFRNFRNSLGEQVDAEELGQLSELQERIIANVGNKAEFDKILRELNGFVTKKEAEFMNLKSINQKT